MNKMLLLTSAVLTFTSISGQAFVVGNSEKCMADKKSYNTSVQFNSVDAVSNELTRAAGKINAFENEPMAFAVDLTGGTAVRVARTGVDVAQDGADAIYKIVEFAAETPQCMSNANKMADGIDCLVQLPNKTVTMTFVAGSNMAENVVVGVYSVGSGILGATEDFTTAIAEGLNNGGVMGEAVAVPFVVMGLVARGLNAVTEVVLYDTVGGAFNQLGKAFATAGTNACDIFSSLVNLQIPLALYHTLGLFVDTLADGANLVIHIISLGQVNLRDRAKKSNYPKDLEGKAGRDSESDFMEGVN